MKFVEDGLGRLVRAAAGLSLGHATNHRGTGQRGYGLYGGNAPCAAIPVQEQHLPRLLPLASIMAVACFTGFGINELGNIDNLRSADGFLVTGAISFGLSALFSSASFHPARHWHGILADGTFGVGIVAMSAWVNALLF